MLKDNQVIVWTSAEVPLYRCEQYINSNSKSLYTDDVDSVELIWCQLDNESV